MSAVIVAEDTSIDSQIIELRHLPPVERAATLVYLGGMEGAMVDGYEVLERWMRATRESTVGYARGLYLNMDDDRSKWVTEIQFTLA